MKVKSKILIKLILMAVILLGLSVTSYGSQVTYFDTGETAKGVLHVTYKGAADKRIKVMIEKEERKYTYDLRRSVKKESFPLQLGSGTYKVKILENTSGNNYRTVAAETIEVKLQDEQGVFLNSVQNIDWTQDMESVKKAAALTKDTKALEEKAKILYTHMVGGYAYDYNKLATLPSTYLPVIDATFRDKKGICYDFSSLYAAMLRSQGIPSKLVKGYTPNAEGYHAWNEVYDASAKGWIIIDTTYDLQVIKSKPKVKMIKSERDYQKVNEY